MAINQHERRRFVDTKDNNLLLRQKKIWLMDQFRKVTR